MVWYDRGMDKELLAKVKEALAAITPEGSRFSVDGYPVERLIELTCDGSDRDMGYFCCLGVGHKGRAGTANKCFSLQKHVDFTRTN